MKKAVLSIIITALLMLPACRENDTLNPKDTGSEVKTDTSEYTGTRPTVTPAESITDGGENISEPSPGADFPENEENADDRNNSAGKDDKYNTGKYTGPLIDGVVSDMLTPLFWTDLCKDPDKVIMTYDRITAYNTENFRNLPFLFDFRDLPDTVNGSEIRKWINELSIVPGSARYDGNGNKYQQKDYEALKENLNTGEISGTVNVRYGITVKRTQMRTWPSLKQSFSSATNRQIDYFTETAVYAAEPVLVYHTSRDGQWYFAQVYNYKGWIPVTDVALCSKQELADYVAFSDFVVVTGPVVYTPESKDSRISRLQLDMGVKLRVLSENSEGYTVNYPVCDNSNNLEFVRMTLPSDEDISREFPDYTVKNVLIQAFKFLGEPYGWGGMNNARDCSAFVADVYRAFGIILPRNTDQQEKAAGSVSLKGKNRSERLEILDSLRPGTLLYMPGHAMMYLGKWQNRHYIIHDVPTVYRKGTDGNLIPIRLNQVSVTPLDICNSKGTEYIMLLTAAVQIE